jgi:hypothetical protein
MGFIVVPNWVQKLILTQLGKKFPIFFDTRKFFAVIITACYWALFCVIWIHYTHIHIYTLFICDKYSLIYASVSKVVYYLQN